MIKTQTKIKKKIYFVITSMKKNPLSSEKSKFASKIPFRMRNIKSNDFT